MPKVSTISQVFLSYASADREIAAHIASRLAEEGVAVFDPADAIFPGDNGPLIIGKALQKCDAMIVLLSPEALKSEWVRQEIDFALGSLNYKNRLFPVLVRPTKEVPWVLKTLPFVEVGKDPAKATTQLLDQLKSLG
jgi:hypothetical protein